ncbi:outer membrane beta-barrel protein [Roseivirga echinicomitans]|nr:outer membrane beta-barrel protein [Roseivirga echinicomitans]
MKPKDGLDQKVKEAADKAHFEFNDSAWAAMEKKLDGVKRAPFVWWKIWGSAGLLVILLLIFLWPNNDQIEGLKNQDVPEKQNTELNENTPPDNKASNPALKEANTESTTPNQSNQKVRAETKPNQSTQENSKTILVIQNESVSDRLGARTDQRQTMGQEIEELKLPLESALLRWYPLADLPSLNLPPIELASFIPEEPLDTTDSYKRWVFSAVISGDMSATTLSGFKKPGPLVGLMVEYFVKNDLSIQTGLSYGSKKYSALGSEYETPYWAQGSAYSVASVYANCRVIDIPLNIQKYFDSKNGNRFFIGTGISSYLMLSEDYDYTYKYSQAGWPDHWQVKNQNQHYFGILNLTAGFERPLTEKLGLGLAPYLKMPLTGIGAGKVKLLSFGVNASIKFR